MDMTSHRILIGIATGIAALTFGMSAAHAAPGDQVWDTPSATDAFPLPDGTCLEPGSVPPHHVPCNSPAATTPVVLPVVASPPVPAAPASPASPLADGTCVQPGSNPPFHVPCDSTAAVAPVAASMPASLSATVPAEPTAAPKTAAELAPSAPRPVASQLPATGSTAGVLVTFSAVLLALGGLLMRVRTATTS